jgi:hypothetical protein
VTLTTPESRIGSSPQDFSPCRTMKPNLFQAIDRIGDRLAARLDWETMSGLPWGELQPYLVPAPGKLAREVLDPMDPRHRLVVWSRGCAPAILESQEIPAHRDQQEIAPDACILHRLNVAKLGADLARTIGFISSPAKNGQNFHRIGMVQVPNRATIDVFLLIPQTPGSAKLEAQRLAAERGGKETMVLLPSARWTAILPAFPLSFEVRILGEFLKAEESDSLLAVAADTALIRKPKLRRSAKSLTVQQGDKWSDLTATFNADTGMLELMIQARAFSVQVWDTRKEEPSKAAYILSALLCHTPPSWSPKETTRKNQKAMHEAYLRYTGRRINPSSCSFDGFIRRNQEAMRQAFLRFQKQLEKWAPIPDGPPFHYDHVTKTHIPKFHLRSHKSIELR